MAGRRSPVTDIREILRQRLRPRFPATLGHRPPRNPGSPDVTRRVRMPPVPCWKSMKLVITRQGVQHPGDHHALDPRHRRGLSPRPNEVTPASRTSGADGGGRNFCRPSAAGICAAPCASAGGMRWRRVAPWFSAARHRIPMILEPRPFRRRGTAVPQTAPVTEPPSQNAIFDGSSRWGANAHPATTVVCSL